MTTRADTPRNAPATLPPPPAPPILVVEDDPRLRSALRRILEAEGRSVLVAEDGWTALDLVHAYRPSMLVVDYVMPRMDGEMLLRTLARELPEVPPAVLLTTGTHQQERAEALGVLGLCKPFRVETLLDAVARHRIAAA